MKKVLVVSMMGMALVSACGSGGSQHAPRGGVVKFVPLGGLKANSYGLAYQTCRETGLTALVRDVHASANVQPQVAANDFAQATFTANAQPSAAQGCLDALDGRQPSPPATTATPAP